MKWMFLADHYTESRRLHRDIEKAHILDVNLLINKRLIKKNEDDTYYIYHSFNTKDRGWSGRWYNVHMNPQLFQWDDKRREVTYIIPEWEEGINFVENVPITIKFTKNGWSKFLNYFYNEK